MFNLNDWLYVYQQAAKQFAERLSYVVMGLLLSFGLLIANVIVTPLLFVGGGILSGLLYSLWQAVLLSCFYYLILSVIRRQRLGFHTFKDGMFAFFYKVLGVRFLLWLLFAFAGNALMFRFQPMGLPLLPILLYFALSPLPETIYQRHDHFLDAFKRVFDFQKENFVIWGVLMVVWQSVFWGMTKTFDLELLTVAPFAATVRGLSNLVILGIGQAIFFLWMVYRGLVYQLLDKSSRRKRAFERRML